MIANTTQQKAEYIAHAIHTGYNDFLFRETYWVGDKLHIIFGDANRSAEITLDLKNFTVSVEDAYNAHSLKPHAFRKSSSLRKHYDVLYDDIMEANSRWEDSLLARRSLTPSE